MKLPPQAIQEFKAYYLARYGVRLADKDAYRIAHKLMRLVKTVQSGEVPHD